jgi:autotransporter-associated beta strand protein
MKNRLHSYFGSAAVIGLGASAAQAIDYNFGTVTENFTLPASRQARVFGVSTGTGTFNDNSFGGVYDRGAAQDALYMGFDLEFMTLAGATINGDVNLNFTVNAGFGGALNNGIIGTPNGAWNFPGSAPGFTPFTPVSAPNATFTTGQTATWTISNSTFTGFLGNLGSFNGLAVTAGDNSQAHFSGPATLTGNYTTTSIRVIDGTDWNAAAWDGGTKTLSIAGTSDVTDGNVILIPGTTLALGDSATLGGGSFSGTFQNLGTLSFGSSAAQTLSGAISGGGTVTQTGSGTLTLSGSNTYTGATTVRAGKLILSGSSSGGGLITVADTTGGKASLEVSGTIADSNALNLGSGIDSVGALRQTAGSVTRNLMALGVTPGSYGAASVSGGSLVITGDMNVASWGSSFQSGGGRGGLVEISGGTVAVGGWLCMSRWGGNQDAVLNVSGGSLTYAGGGLVANWNADGADTSVITVSGSGSIATTNNSAINLSWSGSAANTGILNLNGGTVTPARVVGGRGFVNFDGGTLRANSDQGDFLAVSAARIYSGGATIDTNTRNITISQALLAPADDGVATIPVTDGGSGYVSAPILTLTGGTGSGATAVANMISDGSGALKIGSVTVTSRGSYTDATGLAVAQIGGGATTPATFGTLALTTNASGGLTKIGAGALTLNGINTFTGGLNVNEGILVINGDTALGDPSGSVTLNGAAIKAGNVTLGGNRAITLGANGGYFSNGSFGSWTVNSQLTGSGFIGFNYDSSVNQSITLASSLNDYSGETRVGTNGPGFYQDNGAAANLKLGDVDALPYGPGKGNVIVGYEVNGTARAILDLNGFDANINGLATNNAPHASVNNSGATAATLTLGNGDATATFGGVIQNTGGTLHLVKTGSGTQTLAGVNTYTGNTTINGGALELADDGRLSFVVSDGGANLVTGSGTATLRGDFAIDTSAVAGTTGGIWTLVNFATLAPGSSFEPTFTVIDFVDPENDGIWTKSDTKGDWSFDESTGELALVISNDYAIWSGENGVAGGENDDDDSDGLTNFGEYAFGLLPNSGASINPIAVPLDKATGTFSYTRRDSALTDLNYTVWFSENLTNWTQDTGAVEGVPVLNGEVETVPVTLSALPGNPLPARLFIQVRAAKP